MKFNIIYADPPWKFKDKNTGGSYKSGAAQKYPVMTIDDICKLPINDIAASDCVLIMWWVGSMPEEALQVAKAWGFKIKTMTGFTWEKQTASGKDHFGMGHWTRQGAENALIAVKGKPKRFNASVRQVIRAPIGKHSEKPAEVRERIVQLCGDLPRVELFARQTVDGWHSWGNEVESTIDLGGGKL